MSTAPDRRTAKRRGQRRDPVSSPWPDHLFGPAADDDRTTWLVDRDGTRLAVDRRRWHEDPGPADLALLERARGPVLDIGCGPGRLVDALVRAGRPALGIDASAAAVASTRRRGAPAVHTSVFGTVPSAGSWGTALLVDGNIGIGGDAVTLLRRTASLLAAGGRILVEVDPPAASSVDVEVRVEDRGCGGDWFPWARVAVGDVAALAGSCGLLLDAVWEHSGRWFALLLCSGAGEQEAAS